MENNFDYNAINKITEELAEKWDISGGVYITHAGKTVTQKTFGYADRENNILNTEKSTYSLRYTSFIFVSLGIMSLVEKRLISLNDRLSEFIPEYVHADEIKIKDMLYMQSAIPDFIYDKLLVDSEAENRGKDEVEVLTAERIIASNYYSFSEALELIKDMPLRYEPGKRSNNSETCRVFLAEVYERVAGESFKDFIRREIIEKLKMTETFFGFSANTVSYETLHETQHYRIPYNEENEGVITLTLNDFAKLASGLVGKGLIGNSLYKKMSRFNEYNCSIGFINQSGYDYTGFTFLGTRGLLYFDRGLEIAAAFLLNENDTYRFENGRDLSFTFEVIRALEGAFTYPKNTKLSKYNEPICEAAMNLEVETFQLEYVCDARTSLAWAYAQPSATAYVLTEGRRAIGLTVLNINRKTKEYHIEIILIDKRFQHRGFGKIMLNEAIKILKRSGAKMLEIEVARSNEIAKKLYESAGFKVVRAGNDECCLRMEV